MPPSAGCINTSSKDVEADPCNGLLLTSCFLPEEVLIHLLSYVDPDLLVFRCGSVCRQWRNIITDSRVWKLKIPRSNVYALSKYSQSELKNLTVNYPWYLFYWVLKKGVPFEQNLLRNNSGQKGLKHWESIRAGNIFLYNEFWHIDEVQSENADSLPEGEPWEQARDGFWNIEAQPIFADPLPESEDFENNHCCFSTSHPLCSKQQLINLRERGFPHKLLDKFQPPITISEWYAGRYDCGCKYYLMINLLDKDGREIIAVPLIERTRKQWQGQEWTKITVVIKKYGPGLRYIKFEHRGRDTQFWAGNYGSKMAGGVVRISLPEVKGTEDEVSNEEPSITIF